MGELFGICHPLHMRFTSLSRCFFVFISNELFSCIMGNVLVEDGMALSLLFFSPYLFHVCLFFVFSSRTSSIVFAFLRLLSCICFSLSFILANVNLCRFCLALVHLFILLMQKKK